MITTDTDTHSETKTSCINCQEMQNDMLHAMKNPHVMLEPTYHWMPYIVEMDFEEQELIHVTELTHIEKEFKREI